MIYELPSYVGYSLRTSIATGEIDGLDGFTKSQKISILIPYPAVSSR